MKVRIFAASVALLLVGGAALAQKPKPFRTPNPALPAIPVTITIDEFGTGILEFPGIAFDLPGVLAPDPGPGGLPSVLTYDLGGPPSLVAGDVGLFDADTGVVLDYIRFNDYGTGGDPNYPASVLFYSDNIGGFDALADTDGPPNPLYDNRVFIDEVGSEGNNGAWYHPGPNDPGFVGGGFDVTYHFISDVPEPGTVALFLSMVVPGGFLAMRRRKR